MNKIHHVRQHDSMECGISCLSMVCKIFVQLNTRQLHIFQLYISDKKRCLKAMRLWNFKNITDGSEELITKYRFQQKNIEKNENNALSYNMGKRYRFTSRIYNI